MLNRVVPAAAGTTADPLIGEARERHRKRRRALAGAVVLAAVVTVALVMTSREWGVPFGNGATTAQRTTGGGSPQDVSASIVSPRQAINVTTVIKTLRGHETIGLGLENVSQTPATVLISLKGHLPLTRGEVLLNAPGEKFRNGTVTDPIPANRFKPFVDLQLTLPKGSAGIVEVDLLRDFGAQGTPSTEIASFYFGH
jgi:hypothetical protein